MTISAAPPIDQSVDLSRLREWMEDQGLDAGPIEDVIPLTGGTQNILLRFRKGARTFVLRRPPPRPRTESNETMRREARVLAALAGTEVPHPRLIAACGDESILGVAFYLMAPVDGFNPVNGLPASYALDPVARHQMGLALVDGAAALGRVDYLSVGLETFGRSENYLARQVVRWRSQLDGYNALVGWPGAAALPGVDRIANYLERHRPTAFRPGILHGDYSIGNVMFREHEPQIAAIIDWELATIGDPLLDLAWLLATWKGAPPEDLPVLRVEPWEGFPTEAELIARYASQTDRDLSAIDWYVVLACFKLGVLLEGSYARACAGHDPIEAGQSLHDTAVILFRRALHRID